ETGTFWSPGPKWQSRYCSGPVSIVVEPTLVPSVIHSPEPCLSILLELPDIVEDKKIDLDRLTLQRKVVNPAFHRSWPTQPFGEVTVSLFKQIDELHCRAELDHANPLPYHFRLTLDALGKIAFNFEFHALDDQLGKYAEAWEQIMNGFSQILFLLFPWLDIFAFLFPSRRKLNEVMKDMDELLYRIIEEKRAEIRNGKYRSADTQDMDLLALMIEAADAEEDPMLTKKELR
ncbi:cytochrome P450, partial [Jimgerdemannia flammicorona]